MRTPRRGFFHFGLSVAMPFPPPKAGVAVVILTSRKTALCATYNPSFVVIEAVLWANWHEVSIGGVGIVAVFARARGWLTLCSL